MALIWMDGFDHYGTDENNMLDGAWAEIDNSTGFFDLSAVNPRTGTHNLRRGTTPSNADRTRLMARRAFGASLAVAGVGAVFYLSELPTTTTSLALFQFRDIANADQVTIWVETEGTIKASRGSSSGVLLGSSASPAIVAAAYQHVECKVTISDAAGTVEVRVNGVTVLSLTGVDTQASANAETSQVALCGYGKLTTSLHSSVIDMDDLFAWDTSGTENNDFLGDRRVRTLFPNGNTASAGWTAVGAASGYECIDEAAPDDETTYIEAAGGTTPTSEFELDALPAVGAIAAIEIVTRARKTNAGTANLQTSAVSGASADAGADRALTEVYTYRSDISELDPATGVPWTQSAVNAVKLRIARTA